MPEMPGRVTRARASATIVFSNEGRQAVFRKFEYCDLAGVNRTFYVHAELDNRTEPWALEINIWPTPEVVLGTAPFYARFEALDSSTLRIDMIDNNGNEWAKRVSLSEAVLTHVAVEYGKTVVSSRRFVGGAGEFQTPLADAMWSRLVLNAMAQRDDNAGRYVFQPVRTFQVRVSA